MKHRYLIFDLDNTLYPKESGLLKQIDRQIDGFIKRTLKVPETEVSKLRRYYWKNYGTTLGGMVACHNINPLDYIKEAYNVDVAAFLKPDPYLSEILSKLDLKKAVFSNSPLEYVEEVLEVLKIRSFFEKIYDIQFCNYLGKPNQSSYFKVLSDLGIEGKDCLLLDDTPANVIGGEKAGITSILYGDAPADGIKWRIYNYAELPGIITKIQAQTA